jgi:hypothetical protein
MVNKVFSRVICVFITGLVLITILFLNSCSQSNTKVYAPLASSEDDEFRTFVAQKGIPHFSFEYPSYYELVSYQPMPDYLGTSVILCGPLVEEEKGNIKHIEITIAKHSQYSKNAKAAVNERIDEYKSYVRIGMGKDFELREKNRVVVAGAEGWEIVYSYTELPDPKYSFPDLEVRDEPTPVVIRDLYFDYQDMLWGICLYSDIATDEQARAEYEHMLRSFKFLD